MARLAVGVVGAVVGFYLGGPVGALQGFSLAYGLSAGLDPNKKVLGPRLDDLKAPQAAYGAVIPYLEGAPRLAGCYIWASAKREVATTTTEGKGGPGVDSTVFTYEIDVLIELAINRCQAIRRIWSNGKLVWSNADDADAETLVAASSTTAWRDLRFYNGAPDQLPDPTYEAAVGVGHAPAYRTRTTVMIEGLNLGGSGQLPILTFEVLSEASQAYSVPTMLADQPSLVAFAVGAPAYSLTAPFDIFVVGADVSTISGFSYSFDVYRVDPIAGTSTFRETFDIGSHLYQNMVGPTDESLYILNRGSGTWDAYTSAGESIALDVTALHWETIRFAKLGDDMVVGAVTTTGIGAGFNDKKLRRYSRADGVLQATSPVALGLECQSFAIGGGFAYALSTDGTTVYKCTLSTLALVDTLAIPAAWNAIQGLLACDGADLYVLGAGSTLWTAALIKWNGSAFEIVAYGADISGGVPHLPAPTPGLLDFYQPPYGLMNFSGGVLVGQKNAVAHTSIRYLTSTVGIITPTLAEVVRRLCIRTGQLVDADLELTELEDDVVRSMAISQVSSTRASIETLMSAYLFEWAEGEKLRAVKRGGASVVTIPFEDLGASPDGKTEPLSKKRTNDLEQVARVSVKYANVLNDSQEGLEQADRLVTASTAEQVVEVPLGFTPQEAKRLADSNTMDAAVSILQIGPIALPRKYAYLEASDVFTVTDEDGSTFRVRGVKLTIGAGLSTFDLVLDDATAIASVAQTDDDYVSSTLLRLLSDTDLEVLDIPILRDADDALGPYAVAGAGLKWSGAQLDKSVDDVTFAKIGTFTTRSVVGIASTTLGDFAGGNTFDDVSSVTVDVGDGVLSSATKTDALAGNAPAYLIGSEIVYACTATFVSAGVYRLTSFLRGLRGTEWAMAGHVAAERVVLLEAAGLRKVRDDATDLDVERFYRATTIGKSVADSTVVPFTDTGIALKPFAPVDLILAASGAHDLTLSWHRRSRYASSLFGTVPLGESAEAYEVDVLDGATVLRTITSSTPTITYTDAQQGADGVDAGTTLDFEVYQISATVGRGYPGTISGSGRHAPLPQISTITVGGAYQSGADLFATFGSTRFAYTTTVPDATLGGIATSLAAVIDASADYVAAAVGAVVTVTGPVSVAEPVTVGQDAGDNVITFATTQTAAPITAGHREEFTFGWQHIDGTATGIGQVYTLRASRDSDGMARTYSATNGTGSLNPSVFMPEIYNELLAAMIASGDRAAFDVDIADVPTPIFYSPLADPLWTVELYSTEPNALPGVGRRGVGVAAIPAARPQITTATLAGTPVTGRTYRVTLGGVNYDYTAGGGDTTMALVAAGLAPVIDAAAAYVATNVGAVITITGAVVNVPFTFSGTVIVSTVTLSAAIAQSAA